MQKNFKQSLVSQAFQDALAEPANHSEELLKELSEFQELGRYSSEEALSSGGMKEILLAEDQMVLRKVAMARPLEERRGAEDLLNFIREARITAKVAHPNIVPIHEIGVADDGLPYYTMKYIQGEDLGQILSKIIDGEAYALDHFKRTRLLGIYIKVCEAVAFAHSQGVVHLDLKPENILVSQYGQVQLCDWGLAHDVDKLEETLEPELKGTPGYISPEQIKQEGIGPCCDIYSLGAILFYILSLSKVFESETLEKVLKKTITGDLDYSALDKASYRVPSPLKAIVKKALSLEDRYQSVDELLRDMEAYLEYYPTKAESPGPCKRFILYCKRHKTATMLGLVSLVILSLVVGGYKVKVQEEVFKRKEIAEKSVFHYNNLAQYHLDNYEFDQAMDNVKLALSHKDNQESHWIKAQLHMAALEIEEAHSHALIGEQRLLEVTEILLEQKNRRSDDFILFASKLLMEKHFPGVARTILWKKNTDYIDLQEHMIFVRKAVLALNPQIEHFEMSLVNGKIHFKAGSGFSRLAPLIHLPVEKLELKNTYIYELHAVKGMSELRYLDLENTQVHSVKPFVGLDLDYLNVSNTNIWTFKHLSQLKLKHLVYKGQKGLGLTLMRNAKDLEKLELDEEYFPIAREKIFISAMKQKGVID